MGRYQKVDGITIYTSILNFTLAQSLDLHYGSHGKHGRYLPRWSNQDSESRRTLSLPALLPLHVEHGQYAVILKVPRLTQPSLELSDALEELSEELSELELLLELLGRRTSGVGTAARTAGRRTFGILNCYWSCSSSNWKNLLPLSSEEVSLAAASASAFATASA